MASMGGALRTRSLSVLDWICSSRISFVVLLPVFPVVLAAPQVQDELPQTPYDVRRDHVFQFTGTSLETFGSNWRICWSRERRWPEAGFLIQEFNREANTIGSKCSDVALSRVVVELKGEIEKIREQVQNIE